jgi:hypothetical protein
MNLGMLLFVLGLLIAAGVAATLPALAHRLRQGRR